MHEKRKEEKKKNNLKESVPNHVQRKAISSDEQEGDLILRLLSTQRSRERHNPTVSTLHQQQASKTKT